MQAIKQLQIHGNEFNFLQAYRTNIQSSHYLTKLYALQAIKNLQIHVSEYQIQPDPSSNIQLSYSLTNFYALQVIIHFNDYFANIVTNLNVPKISIVHSVKQACQDTGVSLCSFQPTTIVKVVIS